MADIVRTARIVIHLEQGKAELDASALAPILQAKEREVELAKEMTQAHAQVARAAEQGAQVQSDAALKLAKNQAEMLSGVQQLGEGLFTVGRSVALFAASGDEDLARMARQLATVQAGMDMFKSSVMLFQGLANILEKTAAGASLVATAETARAGATAATVPPTVAATAATTGLAAAVGALALPVTLVVGAFAALLVVYKLATDGVEEAEEAQRQLREEMERLEASAVQSGVRERERERQRAALLAERMTREEQLLELQRRQQQADAAPGILAELDTGVLGGGTQAALEEQRKLAEDALSALREEAGLRKEIRDEQLAAIDEGKKLIEQRRDELILAEEVLRRERDKVAAFEAQFGAMTKGQQDRLKNIAEKVRDGETLNRGEIDFLGRFGGEQGRAIAFEQNRQRGMTAGAGSVFDGIALGSPEVEAATIRRDEAERSLSSATGGQSASDALQDLQDQEAETRRAYEEFLEGQRAAWERAIAVMGEVDSRLSKLETAAAVGRAQ